jgi:hypothetical protein
MKTKITRWLQGAGAGMLVGGVALFAAGCASSPPMAETANLNGAPCDYAYYPDLNVYYYPSEGTYVWYADKHWRSGHQLPPRYTIGNARYERRRFHRPYPWPTPDDFATRGY